MMDMVLWTGPLLIWIFFNKVKSIKGKMGYKKRCGTIPKPYQTETNLKKGDLSLFFTKSLPKNKGKELNCNESII